MRLLKALYFQLKMRYSKWLLAFLALIFIAGLLGRHNVVELPYLTVIVMSLFLSAAAGGASIVKSDLDFVFTTPVKPLEVFLMKSVADGLMYFLVLSAYTLAAVKGGLDALYYAVSLLSLVGAISSMMYLASYTRLYGYIITPAFIVLLGLGVYMPALSPLYGLYEPSPLYAAYDLALFLASAAPLRKAVEELASNAYELLGGPAFLKPAAAGSVKGAGLPKSFWGAVWTVTVKSPSFRAPRGAYASRVNAIKVFLPVSAVGAAAYYFAAAYMGDQGPLLAFSAGFSFYLVFVILLAGSSGVPQRERLWISLSSDPARYFKYKISATTALAAVLTSPWIVAYALEGLWFRPAVYLAVALGSAALYAPALGWIVSAYAEAPQIRELDVAQSTYRLSLRQFVLVLALFFALGLSTAPFGLAVAARYLPALSGALYAAADVYSAVLLGLSAAFFYFAISPKGYEMWRWVVDKLSANGYV